VRDLVAALRRAAGQGGAGDHAGEGAASRDAAPPRWLDASRVVATLDADALLDAGQVPLPLVNERARALGPGELLRIDSGFRPVPLLEALAKQGFRSFAREVSGGRFETFVARLDASAVRASAPEE
jgi:hypothetical protein